MKIFSRAKFFVVVIMSSLLLTSCGGNSGMVNGVQIGTENIDGDIYLSLTTDLNIGNVQFAAAQIPIFDPDTREQLGSVSMVTDEFGQSSLQINVNLTRSSDFDLSSAQLPNGMMLPMIGQREVIVVPLGKGAELYISLTSASAIVGISIPVSGLDSIGRSTGPLTFMPFFNANNYRGAAGIYNSFNAGENGIAVVVDATEALSNLVKSNELEDQTYKMAQKQQSLDIDWDVEGASRSQERKVKRALYRLHKKGTVLSID